MSAEGKEAGDGTRQAFMEMFGQEGGRRRRRLEFASMAETNGGRKDASNLQKVDYQEQAVPPLSENTLGEAKAGEESSTAFKDVLLPVEVGEWKSQPRRSLPKRALPSLENLMRSDSLESETNSKLSRPVLTTQGFSPILSLKSSSFGSDRGVIERTSDQRSDHAEAHEVHVVKPMAAFAVVNHGLFSDSDRRRKRSSDWESDVTRPAPLDRLPSLGSDFQNLPDSSSEPTIEPNPFVRLDFKRGAFAAPDREGLNVRSNNVLPPVNALTSGNLNEGRDRFYISHRLSGGQNSQGVVTTPSRGSDRSFMWQGPYGGHVLPPVSAPFREYGAR
mmetsp:Transcript_11008/g.33756  ORF Transcript_11008/g.33756 Transcript_11008/m.33756 type:complete len:332 (+) Transcript_11008:261-1256(+)